jgi:zinc transporter ZupT|mmetsp:Transcript_1725/g.2402  ORF Transcript_1725/g.2402 Transcript_1725/m.2402 type:complete len:398 (+) Transcript_1725:90-1283(+)|eukprot:CAMPEP_0185576046 /NCGR_PEP_ID=MMETSP0434-20130131/7072_1 /TAXON_ID=626734 ORGANISM="Favella taraikaensis, Strain Fe Narragansett Bay" /NCGR_SAMPLE_ID=MMETSP0434 /ASSEMBLY_ACC=CAM_ASM_000379 /LENGTH=397 /DNA_ID=CAMNT_0028193113 /DNA_START=84 /DNA_END=1277 /DNA_ORIENTATION=+
MLAAAEGENDTAIFWSKIGFILAAFAEGLIAGMIPTWSQGCRESPKILGIANSFAAGVFLAIAFVHITPEMVETWEGLDCNQNKDKIFPLPEALIFVGYTIILMIDKVLFDTHALFDHEDGHGHGHDHADPAEAKLEKNLRASMVKSQALANQGDVRASRIEEKEGVEDSMKSYLNPHDRFATRMRASMKKSGAAIDDDTAAQQHLFVDGANVDLKDQMQVGLNTDQSALGSKASMREVKEKSSCCPNMTPFILMIALSTHSIFEGLAVGLAKTESAVINMLIAILVHKGAASSSLGISLVKTFPNDFKLCRWLIFIFALSTPLGVGIGMAVSNAGDIYSVIFSSIAAGSFVYIACTEVIVEEFSIPGNRYWKLLAFLFGAALITCLFFIEKPEDEE